MWELAGLRFISLNGSGRRCTRCARTQLFAAALKGLFIRAVTRLAAFRDDALDFIVRSWDNVYAYQLADASRGSSTRIGGSFHRTDVTTHENRDVSGADVFLADKLDICGFTIASAASTAPTKPFVSTIPSASKLILRSSLYLLI